jgi:hypothetical protein
MLWARLGQIRLEGQDRATEFQDRWSVSEDLVGLLPPSVSHIAMVAWGRWQGRYAEIRKAKVSDTQKAGNHAWKLRRCSQRNNLPTGSFESQSQGRTARKSLKKVLKIVSERRGREAEWKFWSSSSLLLRPAGTESGRSHYIAHFGRFKPRPPAAQQFLQI